MIFDPSILQYWPFILSGFEINILLAIATAVTASIVGLALAIGRLYGPRPLSILLTFYIDTMRAIPELVVLIWIFFAVPILTGLSLEPFWAALIALTVQVAAYVAEVWRAGLTSIRRSQTYAGLSLGMSHAQVLRKILLPQAFVRMMPAYGSLLTMIIKDTAIASLVAVPELMSNSMTLQQRTYEGITIYTIAMALFFAVLFPTTRLVEFIYRRTAHLGRS